MIAPPGGTKQQVFGGVLAGLGALIALLSRTLGFELDPFFVVMGTIGAGLFLHGTTQRRSGQKQVAAHRAASSRMKQR